MCSFWSCLVISWQKQQETGFISGHFFWERLRTKWFRLVYPRNQNCQKSFPISLVEWKMDQGVTILIAVRVPFDLIIACGCGETNLVLSQILHQEVDVSLSFARDLL